MITDVGLRESQTKEDKEQAWSIFQMRDQITQKPIELEISHTSVLPACKIQIFG